MAAAQETENPGKAPATTVAVPRAAEGTGGPKRLDRLREALGPGFAAADWRSQRIDLPPGRPLEERPDRETGAAPCGPSGVRSPIIVRRNRTLNH
jgi:hypothetical protein